MRKKNAKYLIIFVTLVNFVLLPAITEAGGLDSSKKKAPAKVEKKVVQQEPLFTFIGRELLIGFEETYMAEKNFQHSRFPEGDIQFESLQHLGTLSYEFIEGQTIKGKLGAARIENKAWGYGKHDYELAWGFGGEWDVVKCINRYFPKMHAALPGEIDMIFSGQYFAIGSDKETAAGGSSLEEEWREWDISITFSKSLNAFTPYIGAALSWAEIKTKLDQNISGVDNFDGTLKADDHIGGFIGTDIDFSKCGKLGNIPFVRDLSAHFEVRAFDELAFTSGLNYIFRF